MLAVPVAFAILYLAMFALKGDIGPLSKPHDRRVAEDFVLHTLYGREWQLSAQRGNVVILNFWGISCGPCMREMPALVRVTNRFRSDGLKTIGICVGAPSDEQDALTAIQDVVERYQIPYPVSLHRPAEGQQGILAVDSVPLTLLIDRRGRLARRFYGTVTETLLIKDIERLLHE